MDWASRRLIYLNSLRPKHSDVWAPESLSFEASSLDSSSSESKVSAKLLEEAKKIRDRTPEEDLRRQYLEIQFKVGTSAVVVSRYLCEHASKISLSVFTRLIDTRLAHIGASRQPAVDKALVREMAKFVDEVVECCANDEIAKLEGQLWCGDNLLCDNEFRQRYYFNTHRKESLLRVRKYVNDVLVDQLPMLTDVQRYMDELTIMSTRPANRARP